MNRNEMKSLYLGFGSNLGDSGHLVTRAIKEVASNPHIEFVKQSSLWRTQPLYDLDQPDFVNAVVNTTAICIRRRYWHIHRRSKPGFSDSGTRSAQWVREPWISILFFTVILFTILKN
jgi:hypothetical protein